MRMTIHEAVVNIVLQLRITIWHGRHDFKRNRRPRHQTAESIFWDRRAADFDRAIHASRLEEINEAAAIAHHTASFSSAPFSLVLERVAASEAGASGQLASSHAIAFVKRSTVKFPAAAPSERNLPSPAQRSLTVPSLRSVSFAYCAARSSSARRKSSAFG